MASIINNNTNKPPINNNTSKTPPQILSAVIIPHGESLAQSIGYDYHAVNWILRNIEAVIGANFKQTLAEEAASRGESSPFPTDPTFRPVVRCPAKGRLMTVSDENETKSMSSSPLVKEARSKFITALAMRSGWSMKACSCSLPNLERLIDPLLVKDFFDPIGSSQHRQTATDVVVVITNPNNNSNDNNDDNASPISLLRSIASRHSQTIRRVWCFVSREARTEELEDWGKETGRLFSLSLPEKLTPVAAAVTVAQNEQNPSASASADQSNQQTTTTTRAACPNFETCENPRCLLRHSENRKKICENQFSCSDSKCNKLHYSVHVRGVRDGPVKMNLLAPTQGKRRALASLGWPLPLCPFGGGATCPHAQQCKSLHFAKEEDVMERAATGAIVSSSAGVDEIDSSHQNNNKNQNMIFVDGIPVLVTKIEVTEGLKRALQNQNQNSAPASACSEYNNYTPPKCTEGENCLKIHFKNSSNNKQFHRDPGSGTSNSELTAAVTSNAGGNSGMGTRQSSSFLSSGGNPSPSDEYYYSHYYANHSHHKRSKFGTGAIQQQPTENDHEFFACVVCGDEFTQHFGVRCNAAVHFTCDECLSSFISISWVAQQQLPGVVPDVRCPQTGCTSVMTDVQICRHVTEEACAKYLERRQAARDANAAAKSMELANEMIRSVEEQYKKVNSNNNNNNSGAAAATATSTDNSNTNNTNQANNNNHNNEPPKRQRTAAEKELWKQQLRGMFPNALMCPQPNCLYGPVVFEDCDDLVSHHGEVRDGVTVDNSCKNCGFFAENRSGWLRWDGEPRLTKEEIEEWHTEHKNTAVTRIFAPDDEEMYDESDPEYDSDGEPTFTAVWNMSQDEIRRLRRNHRQQQYNAPPTAQVPPVRGAWMQATSGQNVIIYHVSGSVQLVFQKNSVGWLFAMRTPKVRQQTLYSDGLFFLDGAESRGVAMELNRNYRQENLGMQDPPSTFFDGFATVTTIDDDIASENDNSSSTSKTPCLTRISLKTSSAETFDIILHPTKLVLPSLLQQGNIEHGIVECDCNPNWFMFCPLAVKDEQGIADGSITASAAAGQGQHNNRRQGRRRRSPDDSSDSDIHSDDDDDHDDDDENQVDDNDDDDEFNAEEEAMNREIASDLVLVHRSGDLAIALSLSSNGWLNFRESRDLTRTKVLYTQGNAALQTRTSLDLKFIPKNQSSLVPIYTNFTFGNWTIAKDRITQGGIRIDLLNDGFGLQGSRANQFKCTYLNESDLKQRIDGACEKKIREIQSGGVSSSSNNNNSYSSNTGTTNTNMSSVPQPTLKAPEPLPEPIRSDDSVSDDDIGFFTSIVLAFIDASSIEGKRIIDNTREMLVRFATPEEAVRFAQYCVEFKMDPTSGDSYQAFKNSAHCSSNSNNTNNSATVVRTSNNNNNNNDDDDDQQQQQDQNHNNIGPQFPSPAPATSNIMSTRTASSRTTLGTTTSSNGLSSAPPTPEELDSVIGITGESKAVATFALRNFGNNVEHAVQYLFYCNDQQGSDPMSATTIMNFKRVLHRQNQQQQRR